ncbi:MAG TPA: sigma-54 dependent transcriptional regulator [Planctomycetota bacterium]|nr:sigma-54 dependent transcriptional regulator [Planctomycetota bacterium]
MPHVMIIDDEASIAWALEQLVTGAGMTCATAPSAEIGLPEIEKARATDQPFGVVILDLRLPGMDGLAALEKIRVIDPDLPVIVLTAHGSMQTGIQAMKKGAYDYMAKPFENEHLLMILGKATERRNLAAEVETLKKSLHKLKAREGDVPLVGTSPAMQEVSKKLGALAETDASVLILGENGTGKDLVARAIHDNSKPERAAGPYVTLNCAALPETLLESELFGHVKGAFTSAIANRPGAAKTADGGTLFLDEIAEMPLASQAKLLRFLEQRSFCPVGSNQVITVNVRVLAATNKDLAAVIKSGLFREDLYYRLNVVNLHMPPLRDRRGDIPLLTAQFLSQCQAEGRSGEITKPALDALCKHLWPGNVRELRNAIVHASIMARGRPITVEHLPQEILQSGLPAVPADATGDWKQIIAGEVRKAIGKMGPNDSGTLLNDLASQLEQVAIDEALAAAENNQVRASRWLGIHRTTLRKKLGLDPE